VKPLPALSEQAVLALLPQTQCTRCGYPDCRAYAQAIATEAAPINQCPPGGQEGIERLAALTGQPALPLNPAHGVEEPRHTVVIDEDWCIGCTLCLKACPVDAIVGANKFMHTVIEPLCTGCDLCIPVCPVDCMERVNVSGQATGWQAWSPELAQQAQTRYEAHQQRTLAAQRKHEQKQLQALQEKAANLPAHSRIQDAAVLDKKQAIIEAALAKARQRLNKPQA
jgi:Na+-translocating ferredoxin:NAD+ oxidoreductase subunit B